MLLSFLDTILMESADNRAAENSFSFIGINAVGGIEISDYTSLELKYPGLPPEKRTIAKATDVPAMLWDFMNTFSAEKPDDRNVIIAQALFGYSTYDAVQFFDTIKLQSANSNHKSAIPLMRYRLYQYVIVINHFKDEMYLCENVIHGLQSDLAAVESLIKSKDVPTYPFKTQQDETSNMVDADYIEMVKKGVQSCFRGDVFQIVLSRRF